jgi:hypothetical protein
VPVIAWCGVVTLLNVATILGCYTSQRQRWSLAPPTLLVAPLLMALEKLLGLGVTISKLFIRLEENLCFFNKYSPFFLYINVFRPMFFPMPNMNVFNTCKEAAVLFFESSFKKKPTLTILS